MAATRAATNKSIRQEALREQLSSQGHLQHALDIANEINEQAATIGATELQAKKAAADLHWKAVNKYLPDLKSMEIEGDVQIRPRVVDLSSGKMDKDAEPDSTV